MLLQSTDGNGMTTFPNLIVTHVNDEPIMNGIKGYQNIVQRLSYPYAGPFRCTNSNVKSVPCCQSQIIDQNPLQCLWDIQSIYNYATMPQLQFTNVVPQMCMDLNEEFLSGDRCASNADCSGVCVGPFHTGSDRFIHLVLKDPFDDSKSYNLNLIGNPLEIQSACNVT
jgi:hypothetical protein